MRIDSITVRLIAAPLKASFATHLQTVTEREAIILEVRDSDGRCGYGEADPFSSPWYSPETIDSCLNILTNDLIPLLSQHTIAQLEELDRAFDPVRGNHMAKSGLIQAVWDLVAKQQKKSIQNLVGGDKKSILAGAVIAATDPEQAIEQIAAYSEAGYKRYKIKISKENDHQLLTAIRQKYPELPLMADANSAYSLADIPHLKTLDDYGLLMIEQPLAWNDLADHACLQKQMQTPICLDESICSAADMKAALRLGSCRVAAIKMARLGGWNETLRAVQLCAAASLPLWCGGMIEFGIAKAHNLALASRAEFVLPGDLFASSRYWEEDIIEPEIQVVNGSIDLPEKIGIGFAVNQKQLDKLTKQKWLFRH